MNIGILYASPVQESEGGYQYSKNVVKCLKRWDKVNNYVLFYTQENFLHWQYEGKNWKTVFLKDTIIERVSIIKKFQQFVRLFPLKYDSKFVMSKYYEIKKHDIDLLYCPSPSLAGHYCRIPYVVTIFDLMQKYYSEFPERPFLSRLKRDFFYKLATRHAKLVIADSAPGKEDIIKFYGIPEEKIEIFPGIPISGVEHVDVNKGFIRNVRKKYNLPEEYIFYPAQLWHHKNHISIVKALYLLKIKHNMRLTAVFTGTKREAFNDIIRKIDKLRIKDQVVYLGYVSENEIRALYKGAIALVMPTFFGPANIPVWEAFILGCPVITSNVCGIPEQVGDAGLLVDPRNAEDIAEKIYRVYIDKNLRERLSRKGLDRVKHPGLEYYTKNLIAALNKAARDG